MSAILKSFDPDAQAARDERISAERLMRMQLFEYKEKLVRVEGELKDAKELVERLRRKISRLEQAKMMAEFEARLAQVAGARGHKRKAAAAVEDSDSEERDDEEGLLDEEKDEE
jgi:hypothetical protein